MPPVNYHGVFITMSVGVILNNLFLFTLYFLAHAKLKNQRLDGIHVLEVSDLVQLWVLIRKGISKILTRRSPRAMS